MNYKTSYNITKIFMQKKLKKLYFKLSNSYFIKSKHIRDTINILLQLQNLNINVNEFKYLFKINKILLTYFRKNNNFKKHFINSNTFIKFLLYLSIDTDFHRHLLELFQEYNIKTKFDKCYHYEIIKIIGRSVETNDIQLYDNFLNVYIFNSIKQSHESKLSYFIPFLINFHLSDNNRLLPKYDYIMTRYVKYITTLDIEYEIIMWLELIKKLVNNHNIIYFFKYSGIEQLNIISQRFKNNSIIIQTIKSFKLKITNYSSFSNTSLHQLCKYHNSLSSVRFMLKNTNINYNKMNRRGKTPLHIAIFKSNKSIIELFIASGVNLDIKDGAETSILDFIHSHLYIYYKTDPFFVNVIQKAFIKRTLNDKIINKTIKKFHFYDDINSIIKLYVDPVSEYFKNETQIEYILKNIN